MPLAEAIREAIVTCISENILTDFFEQYDEEVREIMLLEYDREAERAAELEDAHEEGFAEGRMKNILANVRSLMKNVGYTAEQAMEVLEVPLSERAGYLAAIG